LWNIANEQRLIGLARPRGEKKYVTAFDQINELTGLRAEFPWIAEVPRNVCAQLLTELDAAWQRCFKKLASQPRWKRKGRDILGLCEPHPKTWRLFGNKLHFPKLETLKIVAHRPLEGKPKTCTIRRDGDQWFACFSCENEIPDPSPRITPVVAIDRGVTNLLADSDGKIEMNPQHLEKALKKLCRAQRIASRRKKGSKNRTKSQVVFFCTATKSKSPPFGRALLLWIPALPEMAFSMFFGEEELLSNYTGFQTMTSALRPKSCIGYAWHPHQSSTFIDSPSCNVI